MAARIARDWRPREHVHPCGDAMNNHAEELNNEYCAEHR